MLDPELLNKLAKTPERNASEVNAALAEEGCDNVLVSLVQSSGTQGEALTVVQQRLLHDEAGLCAPLEDELPTERAERARALAAELRRVLAGHPHSSAEIRDALLRDHGDDPYFVLATAMHRHATEAAIEHAARWPPPLSNF